MNDDIDKQEQVYDKDMQLELDKVVKVHREKEAPDIDELSRDKEEGADDMEEEEADDKEEVVHDDKEEEVVDDKAVEVVHDDMEEEVAHDDKEELLLRHGLLLKLHGAPNLHCTHNPQDDAHKPLDDAHSSDYTHNLAPHMDHSDVHTHNGSHKHSLYGEGHVSYLTSLPVGQ